MAKGNKLHHDFFEEAAKTKAFLAEKHVSYIRALVIVLGTVTFLLMDKQHISSNLPYFLLIPIWLYGLWVIVFKSYKKYPILMAAWFTFISDTIFGMVWIYATGGYFSPFYVMLYTSIIAVAFRFSMRYTFIISTIYTICYFLLMVYLKQLQGNEIEIIVRMGFLYIIGYFAALLIEETHEQVKAKHIAESFKAELEKQVEQRTEELESSLQEVNTLLKEVHHRVKNNLQIISSLLNLQSNEQSNPEVKEALLKSKNRILSIALIHQNLYGPDNLSTIKARDFIEQLVESITKSIEQDASKINVDIRIPNDLFFSMDTMTPLGLLLNELLTNSYKYAFQKNEHGDISISINAVSANQFLLEYYDSGPGLPDSINFKNAETLGLALIRILSEQINGKVEYSKQPQSKFKVEFSNTLKEVNKA